MTSWQYDWNTYTIQTVSSNPQVYNYDLTYQDPDIKIQNNSVSSLDFSSGFVPYPPPSQANPTMFLHTHTIQTISTPPHSSIQTIHSEQQYQHQEMQVHTTQPEIQLKPDNFKIVVKGEQNVRFYVKLFSKISIKTSYFRNRGREKINFCFGVKEIELPQQNAGIRKRKN
jgi:hypothetical protein